MALAAASRPAAASPTCPAARKALALGDVTNTSNRPSPHAVSPLLSPVLCADGGAARRRAAAAAAAAAAASTPQPACRSAAAAAALADADEADEAPWKESWTDEVFSADITLPMGFDIESITGAGAARTERVEVDTGTVITVEAVAGADGSVGGQDSPGNVSIVICGNDERNVDEARARIEDFLSATSQLDESGMSAQKDDADAVAALSSRLFEVELQLLQQEDERSQTCAAQRARLPCSLHAPAHR